MCTLTFICLSRMLLQEAWFYVRTGNTFKKKDVTSETLTLQGKMDVDPDLRQALIDSEDGMLRPGALPKMATSSAAGNKQLLDAIDKVLSHPPRNQCHSGDVGPPNHFQQGKLECFLNVNLWTRYPGISCVWSTISAEIQVYLVSTLAAGPSCSKEKAEQQGQE